jgi:TonB-dependent starch-binding outer membrane protein SusC
MVQGYMALHLHWTFTQAGNPDLQWETSDKYDVGLSFGMLKDRIQVDLNWFYNDVNDLILNVPQSPSKGVPGNTIPMNIGSMFNTGYEVSFTSYNFSGKGFSWTTNFNISTVKNEVTELAPGVTEIVGTTGGLETTSRTFVGHPVGNIFGIETRGVDPETGRRIFVNADGKEVLYQHEAPASSRWIYRDGTGNSPAISLNKDGKILGSPIPTIYGGFDNSFTIKNFDLSVNLTYALGFEVYNGSQAGLRDQRWWNNTVEVYEKAWRNPGDVTNIPKPIFNDNVSNGSTMVISENVEKGDYLKVRNISAGYSFKIPGSLGIENVRLYAQVFNAYVFTSYSGSDPEVSTNANSNLAPGIDRNTVPQARTYAFGVNLTF